MVHTHSTKRMWACQLIGLVSLEEDQQESFRLEANELAYPPTLWGWVKSMSIQISPIGTTIEIRPGSPLDDWNYTLDLFPTQNICTWTIDFGMLGMILGVGITTKNRDSVQQTYIYPSTWFFCQQKFPGCWGILVHFSSHFRMVWFFCQAVCTWPLPGLQMSLGNDHENANLVVWVSLILLLCGTICTLHYYHLINHFYSKNPVLYKITPSGHKNMLFRTVFSQTFKSANINSF